MQVSLETNFDLCDTLSFLEDEITCQSPESMSVSPPDEDDFDDYLDEILEKLYDESDELVHLFVNGNKPLILEKLICYNHLLPFEEGIDENDNFNLISRWIHFRMFTHQGLNLLPFDNELELQIIHQFEVYHREVYDDGGISEWYENELSYINGKIEAMKEFFYHHPKGNNPPESWMNDVIVSTIGWIYADLMKARLHSWNESHLDRCFALDSHFVDESKG